MKQTAEFGFNQEKSEDWDAFGKKHYE